MKNTTLSSEIANFIEDYKHLKFPSITKQGGLFIIN